MPYVIAILMAGLWAAFLLPLFFDHRSRAPRTTTRDFARTRKLLHRVTVAQPEGQDYVRHHAQARRQRILVSLVSAALVSLVVATWTGSMAWLWLAIALDVTFAAYVGLLLHTKQQRLVPRASVVSIDTVQTVPSDVAIDELEFDETPTVRVIAG